MLEKVDTFVLEKLEKFSQKIERVSGWNCFWLARICVAYLIIDIGIRILSNDIWLLIETIAVAGFIFAYFAFIPLCEKRCYAAQEKGGSNPLKILSSIVRKFLALLGAIIIALSIIALLLPENVNQANQSAQVTPSLMFFNIIGMSSFVLYCYFISCDPLKPGEEKQKEKIPAQRETTPL